MRIRNSARTFVVVVVALFACAAPVLIVPRHVFAAPSAEAEQEIVHLIGFVKGSSLVFLRNGEEHTGSQAAEHIEKKYVHFKEKIQTAEDFIDRCASASLLSGKPYLVRLAPGQERPVKEWLGDELRSIRTKK